MKKKFVGLRDECGCIVCPACSRLFEIRRQGKCPLCGTRLVYPGEYFSSGGEGYYFGGGDWHKISEAGKNKEA